MLDEVGQRAQRVTRDVDAARLDVAHAHDVPGVDSARHAGDALAIRHVRDDFEPQLLGQLLVAADVVPVVVRAPDGPRAYAFALQRVAHRRRLGGVDDGGVPRAVDDQVGVVVFQARDGNDAHQFPPCGARSLRRAELLRQSPVHA